MDIWTLILLGILLGLSYLVFSKKTDNSKKLPPGPKGLPLLGYAPFLRPPMFLAFTKLGKTYGDIVAVKIGSLQFILLNSYDAFRKTLLDNADNFSGRLQSDFINSISQGCGLIFVDGPRWTEHRRFSLRVLKDFGLGKSLSERIIQTEAEVLIDRLNSCTKDGVDTTVEFSGIVSNVICTLAFGDRPSTESDNVKFSEIMKKMHYIAHSSTFLNMLPIIFPTLVHLVPLRNLLFGKPINVRYTEAGHDYIREKISHIRENMKTLQEPTNLTEAYLMEQARLSKTTKDHTFSDFQLMRLIFELFIAGTDTSAMALTWACLLLSLHPDIQVQIHKEIDEFVGRERKPGMADRKSLNYVQAVLDEVARYSSLAPTGIPHRNFESVVVNGFTIPTNSVVIPNIYSVHRDPAVWQYPEKFYPQHFLSPTGEYLSRPELVFFGLGKRSCLGESLARSEMFIFFVTIMQHFKVELSTTGKKNLSIEELVFGSEGTVRAPGKHRIVFVKRTN